MWELPQCSRCAHLGRLSHHMSPSGEASLVHRGYELLGRTVWWTISITVIPSIASVLRARRGPRASVASWWGSPWRGSSRWRLPRRGSSGRRPPWRSSSGWSPSDWPHGVTWRSDAYWMPRGSGTWTSRDTNLTSQLGVGTVGSHCKFLESFGF